MHGYIRQSNHDYHHGEGLSSSKLKKLALCSAIFASPEPEEDKSDVLKIGSLYHTIFFEPETLLERYVVLPKIDKRTTEYKTALKELADRGKEFVVAQADVDNAMSAKTVCLQHNEIREMLDEEGEVELAGYWTENDILMKFKPDKRLPRRKVILDLKTTSYPMDFSRELAKYDYHLSAAHYLAGARAIEGVDYDFCFLVVSKEAPYLHALYRLDARAIEKGMEKRAKAVDNYVDFVLTGVPNGLQPNGKCQDISLPPWYR